jgi:hypothetical protein
MLAGLKVRTSPCMNTMRSRTGYLAHTAQCTWFTRLSAASLSTQMRSAPLCPQTTPKPARTLARIQNDVFVNRFEASVHVISGELGADQQGVPNTLFHARHARQAEAKGSLRGSA